MKATHRLADLYTGSEWLLKCDGREHFWCKVKGSHADSVWRGPAKCGVEAVFGDDFGYVLTKLNTFKGNK